MRPHARRIEISKNAGRNEILVYTCQNPTCAAQSPRIVSTPATPVDLIQAVPSRTSLKAGVEHAERVPQENVASAL